MKEVINYIIEFLLNTDSKNSKFIHYGSIETAKKETKVIITPSNFFNEDVYGNRITIPEVPLQTLNNKFKTPILFGLPKEKVVNGTIIIYADIVASAFFMLSRYEEIIKPECRDIYGRFLAKDSVVFQQGYGLRPVVDEYGQYLREKLKEAGLKINREETGFSKIWLTHDVDVPFRFYKPIHVVKQWIKNAIRYGEKVEKPLRTYFNEKYDPYYTFPEIIKIEEKLKESFSKNTVSSVYFIISRGSRFTRNYCNILSKKFKKLLILLKAKKSLFGVHLSHESGIDPKKIKKDLKRYKKLFDSETIMSRHHFLRWTEPNHVCQMEENGITDDFTLTYADSIGFRVGTSRPYRFINPKTKQLTKLVIHPTVIMECSLDREKYMALSYEDAFKYCKKVIDQVYNHNGELVLLWHNNSFADKSYQKELYLNILEYLQQKET